MGDVAASDVDMTISVAEVSMPLPTEASFRPAEPPFPGAPADEPRTDATIAQPPTQSEADRMPPTPVSDEPGSETRPG